MKTIKVLFTISSILAFSTVSAQLYYDQTGGSNLVYQKKEASQPAEGSQYFVENYLPAHINGSKEVSTVRYNAFNDQIEAKVNNEELVLTKQEGQVIKMVDNQNTTYELLSYMDENGDIMNGYLILLTGEDKNVKIYKRERVYLQPEQHAKNSYQTYRAPMYKKASTEYYIKIKDGIVSTVPSKKKDLSSLIPGKEDEIKDFVKENRISTSDEEDLKKLGVYLNTLM